MVSKTQIEMFWFVYNYMYTRVLGCFNSSFIWWCIDTHRSLLGVSPVEHSQTCTNMPVLVRFSPVPAENMQKYALTAVPRRAC